MAGGSKKVTVGYRYFMGVQLALTHGEIDAIYELKGDDTTAWSGNVTSNTTISVNAANLFGGQSREGGWVGKVDIQMGGESQSVNAYLDSKIAGPVPAFRGLVTTVFRGDGGKGFEWSSGNPYFKAPAWRIGRYVKGWSRNTPWYPTKAKIGRDMNPVHIVYECLTNIEWGMGYSPSDIDDTVFRAAADTIYGEAFGLSLLWTEQATIQDFIKLVLTHIDANIRINVKTGLFEIKLIRNNYDTSTLPELNPSNILQLTSFQRAAWGDTANEVVVTYTDRNQDEVTIAVQDLASIETQGALISVTREYVGIREDSLATRVAMRDLGNVSSPLAKVTLICNRIAWDWDVTDVFVLTWPKLGLNRVSMRIIKITKGDLINGQITIEAMEDIFGLPASGYMQQQPSGWVDPISAPVAVTGPRAMEVPYWDVVRNLSAADMDYLQDDYAFGETLAVKPTDDAFDYGVWAGPNTYTFVNTGAAGNFTPSGLVVGAIAKGGSPVTLTLTNMSDVDEVEVGTYAYIDNEAFLITSVNADTGVVIAGRATLDTVPSEHVAGSRIYFADDYNVGADPTERVSGEVVYYKPLTRTGKGVLELSAATSVGITLAGRAHRPYPPANLSVNSVAFPTTLFGSLYANWSNRNRLQQTVSLIPFNSGNITPEVDQLTVISVYSGVTLKRTYTVGFNLTSWSYPVADDIADGAVGPIRLTFATSRTGLASWQKHDLTIDRHGLGFHLGEELGGVAP